MMKSKVARLVEQILSIRENASQRFTLAELEALFERVGVDTHKYTTEYLAEQLGFKSLNELQPPPFVEFDPANPGQAKVTPVDKIDPNSLAYEGKPGEEQLVGKNKETGAKNIFVDTGAVVPSTTSGSKKVTVVDPATELYTYPGGKVAPAGENRYTQELDLGAVQQQEEPSPKYLLPVEPQVKPEEGEPEKQEGGDTAPQAGEKEDKSSVGASQSIRKLDENGKEVYDTEKIMERTKDIKGLFRSDEEWAEFVRQWPQFLGTYLDYKDSDSSSSLESMLNVLLKSAIFRWRGIKDEIKGMEEQNKILDKIAAGDYGSITGSPSKPADPDFFPPDPPKGPPRHPPLEQSNYVYPNSTLPKDERPLTYTFSPSVQKKIDFFNKKK